MPFGIELAELSAVATALSHALEADCLQCFAGSWVKHHQIDLPLMPRRRGDAPEGQFL